MSGPQSKQIGGSTVTVAPLPFGKGREGLLKLLAVIAPTLADALVSGGSATVMPLLRTAGLTRIVAEMLMHLPGRLDEPTLAWFEAALGSCSTATIGDPAVTMKLDTPGNREMVFGNLGYMAFFDWLRFALEVNYSVFFSEALAKLPIKKPAQEGSTPTQ